MKKFIIIALISLAAVLLLAAAAFPTFVSTDFGKEIALKCLNRRLMGQLTIDNLQLSWLGKQRIEGLIFEKPDGKEIFSFQSFETDASLLYLLFGGRNLNRTFLQDPFLLYEKKEATIVKNNNPFFTFGERLFVQNGRVILDAPKISPITLSNINIEKQARPEIFYIEAKTQQGGVQGELLIEGNLKEETKLQAKISNFPVAILDQLEEKPLYTAALGESLNLDITLEKEGQTLPVKATCESSNLKAFLQGEIRDKKLYLDSASHLLFTLRPAFFTYLIAPNQQESWNLASPADVSIQIDQAIIPLDFPKRPLALQALAKVARAEIEHKDLGSYSLNNFSLSMATKKNLELTFEGEIKGKQTTQLTGSATLTAEGKFDYTVEAKGFPISLLELFTPEIVQLLPLFIDQNFDFSAQGTYYKETIESQFSLTSTTVQIGGDVTGKLLDPNFEITGDIAIVGDKAKLLGPSIQLGLNGSLDIRKKSALFSGKLTNPYLQADLRGKIGETFDQMHLVLTGEILKPPFEEPYIDSGTFFIHVDGSKNLITGKIQTTPAKMDASFEIEDYIHNQSLDFKQARYTFHADIKELPLAVLNPFMPEGIDLTLIVGATGNIKASGVHSPDQKTLDLKADSQGFIASFALTVNEEGTLTVEENGPAYIHLNLTPHRYQALIEAFHLTHPPSFLLTRAAPVSLNITHLVCPTAFPEEISSFLCQSGFTGNISIGTLFFQNPQTQESLIVEGTSGFIKAVNLSQAIDVALKGNFLAANIPQSESSAFFLHTDVYNFWTEEGKFNREGLTVKGELSLELLPVRQLTGIIPMEPKTRQTVEAVLGELINARLYGEISQLSGPLTIDIKASNFKAILPLQLTPNTILLRDAVEAEITLTAAVNEAFLKEINPFLAQGAYSNQPVKVYIDPAGFMVPIRPFTFKEVQVGSAIFDIGRISIYNGEEIQSLMKFLKAPVSRSRYIPAWFTPIYMSLKDGVASYKRFDALIGNTVHVALWGKINLINDRVNMMLGISPATLQQRFNISGLQKKDMFQVKVRGTTDNLDFDWSSAYTRIAIILARTAGGGIGYIIGGIVEQIVSALGEEPSPPPTTVPFPWAK